MAGFAFDAERFGVRRAEFADLAGVLPLVSAYRVFYGRVADEARERAYIEAHLKNGTSTIFIAEADGAIVGFAQLFETYNTVRLEPAFILEDLYVDERARGSGIASALLHESQEFARKSGASQLFLETANDNTTAQRVYEKAGWQREDHFIKYNAPI